MTSRPSGSALVLLNEKAGKDGEGDAAQVRAALARAGVEAEVREVPGERLRATAREAAAGGTALIVGAGGDGTISAVAAGVTGSDSVLGVLAMGTLNHFAKDLRLPLDLDGACAVLAHGTPHAIDVGEVNGEIFINNASIGIYPHVVRAREHMQIRLGHGKWKAMAIAIFNLLRGYPILDVSLHDGKNEERAHTPFVFVGNNEYRIDLLQVGTRDALDGGELSLYFAHDRGRLTPVRLALLALVGRLEQHRDFESRRLTRLDITDRRNTMHIAIDGEVRKLATPLSFRIRPKALKVVRGLSG